MEKSRWLDFLTPRLQSQISLENAEKAQVWAFALFGLASFGAALGAVGGNYRGSASFFFGTKILFLILFYAILLLGVHLPGLLQKGEKPFAKLLGVRDLTSLMLVSLAVTFYSIVLLIVSHQAATGTGEYASSTFLSFMLWVNDIVIFFHTAACLLFILSLVFFPKTFAKAIEFGAKFRFALLGTHSALFLLLSLSYFQVTELGSSDFFEQLRVAGLFWIFIASSVLLIGRLLRESAVPALASLELEVATRRLDRDEDILARFKEAFISRRLVAWLGRLAHGVATKTEKLARFSHEAVSLVNREKPSEVDLGQVEDRTRRAETLHRQLEKENQRFLLSISLFDLSELSRAKVEELREMYSRELRNAKLEVASVRKRIDERLTALKNQTPVLPVPSPAVPVS